jgi:hypothetical protein
MGCLFAKKQEEEAAAAADPHYIYYDEQIIIDLETMVRSLQIELGQARNRCRCGAFSG